MNRATTLAAGFLLLLALMPASSADAGEPVSDAEAAMLNLTCTDKISTETTYTLKCGGGSGGGGGGGGGGTPDPHEVLARWREFIENGIGDPDLGLIPDDTPGAGTRNSCAKTEDDGGFGGTHVSCSYSCGKTNELAIVVQASDKDATTYANTECADQQAGCAAPAATCTDVSDGLTSYAGSSTCSGHSDEVFDSPVRVSCYAIGPDTALCLVNPSFCEAGAVQEFCVESDPFLASLPSEDVAALLPDLPVSVVSMVSFLATSIGGLAVHYEVDPTGQASCTVQAF